MLFGFVCSPCTDDGLLSYSEPDRETWAGDQGISVWPGPKKESLVALRFQSIV